MSSYAVYERAKAELHECEKRAARLRSFIATFDELTRGETPGESERKTEHEPSQLEQGSMATEVSIRRHEPVTNSTRPYDYSLATSPEEMEEMAVATLREFGRPLNRKVFFEAVKKKGAVIVGKNPLNTFSTRLNRSTRIQSVFGEGYWLADEPVPDRQEDRHGASDTDEDSSSNEMTLLPDASVA